MILGDSAILGAVVRLLKLVCMYAYVYVSVVSVVVMVVIRVVRSNKWLLYIGLMRGNWPQIAGPTMPGY